MIIYLRLILIAAVLGLAIWFIRRLFLAAARNPNLRHNLSNIGGTLLRVVLLRYVLSFIIRAVRLLRFFR